VEPTGRAAKIVEGWRFAQHPESPSQNLPLIGAEPTHASAIGLAFLGEPLVRPADVNRRTP
jgi:hypothetical protein